MRNYYDRTRGIVDMSSIMWTCLLVGNDVDAVTVDHNERRVNVNSAEYGYENAVNSLVAFMDRFSLTPKDLVLVFEGRDSKRRRCMIDATYKANREGPKDSRPPQAYEQFNRLKEMLKQTFRDLGAVAVSQPFVEGDDVIAYMVQNAEEDTVVHTFDNDLVVLNGVNEYGSTCMVHIQGEVGVNKYGKFDFKLVELYKSLVGDSSDNVKGCPGFGPKAWESFLETYEQDGAYEMLDLIHQGKRDQVSIYAEGNDCKLLRKLVAEWDSVTKSNRLVQLHPEWVNTVKNQLEWLPGMVTNKVEDERLNKWKTQWRVITADNYDAALKYFKSKIDETPYFTLDFETTTPPESDDWLESRGKKNGVDVMASTIVSMGLTFGSNVHIGYYISVNHADTNNCTKEQLAELMEAIPNDKMRVAHNAAGFELVVAFNEFGERWKNNGWRGFIPNLYDSRIAASYWDENQPSHGLKALSQLLLGYTQATYEETVTLIGTDEAGNETKTLRKMHQLTAAETTTYGLDDVYTTGALWNFFDWFMQLDHTRDAFFRLEQKPTYVSALAYVQGLDLDLERMSELTEEDKSLFEECWSTVESFLIEKGWDGVTTPVFDKFDASSIKRACEIVLGTELKTMVRTPSKLAILVWNIDHDRAEMLAGAIEGEDLELFNRLVKRHFVGKPNFNVGSPNQIAHLLYEVMKIPIRLRNKATDAMKAKGIREGNPRTDDGAINMAIKMGDVKDTEAKVLESLLTLKSCNTRNSLYWSAYPYMVHWKTGKLHPELRQSSTNTRRWTSGNPNIQQTEASNNGVRSCLTAGGRGRVFVSLDESSQEVRQVADYSQDANLLSCYIGDHLRDTHSIVGAKVAKVTYEEFMRMRKSTDQKEKDNAAAIRQIAKVVLFAVLYGAVAPKIAETLGITEKEAQTYIDAIFSEFPDVKKWKEQCEEMAQKYGYVTIAGGTKRHLANLVNSENAWEASKALRQAGNARIQSAGANQIKTVMTRIWDSNLLDDTSLQFKFPCHDEICFTAHKDDALKVIKTLHGFMTEQFLETVPSVSSVGIGHNYGQLIELEDAFKGAGVDFSDEVVQETIDSLF